MTLLEMIKKYEGVKSDLEMQQCRVPPKIEGLYDIGDGINVTEHVLRDLKSIRYQQPSWVTVRVKIMKKIDKALESDDPESALKLAQTLSILPG